MPFATEADVRPDAAWFVGMAPCQPALPSRKREAGFHRPDGLQYAGGGSHQRNIPAADGAEVLVVEETADLPRGHLPASLAQMNLRPCADEASFGEDSHPHSAGTRTSVSAESGDHLLAFASVTGENLLAAPMQPVARLGYRPAERPAAILNGPSSSSTRMKHHRTRTFIDSCPTDHSGFELTAVIGAKRADSPSV